MLPLQGIVSWQFSYRSSNQNSVGKLSCQRLFVVKLDTVTLLKKGISSPVSYLKIGETFQNSNFRQLLPLKLSSFCRNK